MSQSRHGPLADELVPILQVVVGPGGFMFDDRVNPDSLPEDIEFREEVLDCFPEADSHHGYPLPEHLPQVREEEEARCSRPSMSVCLSACRRAS